MAIASMTGFARMDGAIEDFSWTWELKSVNGRNLDIRCRVPASFESLEPIIRSAAGELLKRGNVNVSLSVDDHARTGSFRINEAALSQIEALMRDLAPRLNAAPPRLDGLLALRGVLEIEDAALAPEVAEQRLQALQQSLAAALQQLHEMRRIEGQRLSDLILGHLDEIERLRSAAAKIAVTQPELLRKRLTEQLSTLLATQVPLSEERLAQEVLLLVAKADIREELDRLAAHVAAARVLIASGGPVGRKLDFLCQEFNREANTLCSKASELALTNIGIDLKAAIEQLREQIQNIE
ncbi:YicC/YloC family endoribonuclease [Dongia soli]|uniref:YicC/YloC family endoribonuclease n=1 Tax=Dongia soli TaxID=600628 RepID=A0ABU5ECD7_9PROT|nr:YicC/YloC family endoribonuclease [Dongia soli]MDY0884026.1 YicC/YloC family endoribonuclease [Dongia soli]